MEVNKVLNPDTGRYILIDGPVFNELLKKGYKRKDLLSSKKKFSAYEKPKEKEYTKKQKKELLKTPIQGKKITTGVKGWAEIKPKNMADKRRLAKECPDQCFLVPDKLKFPICPKCKKGKPCKCVQDCRGLIAAKSRAGAWKYNQVKSMADKIAKKKGCSWASTD